jgi:hypothetical protein
VPYDPLGRWDTTHGNKAQAEFHEAARQGKRFLALFGGSGLGKSMSAAREAEIVILRPKTTTWIVGPTYGLAEKEFRYIWEDLITTHRLPTRRATRDSTNRVYRIEFMNGSVVEGKSEENEKSLLGEGIDCLVLAEGAQLKPLTYQRWLRRAVGRRTGMVICNTTPRGMNWVHDEFLIPALDGKEGYWAQVYDVLNNPFYDREEYERAKRDLTDEIFREQFQGEFVRFSGLVFNTFDRRVNCRKDMWFDESWPLWCMIDLNQARGHAVSYMSISPYGQRLFVDSIWHKCSLEELSEMMRQKAREMGRFPNHMIYDGPEIDTSHDGSHIRRLMASAGISGKRPRKLSKGAQFMQMDALFKQTVQTDRGHEPLILIDPVKNPQFVWELERLEWHESKSELSDKMIPKERGDDMIDCWRYAEAEGIFFQTAGHEHSVGQVDFGRNRTKASRMAGVTG